MKRTLKSCIAIAGMAILASCSALENEGDGNIRLFVSTESLEFDEENPDNNTFIVTSNVAWRAEGDIPELKFEPENGGAGDTRIQITDMAFGRSGTITVTTVRENPNDAVASETVTIRRGPSSEPGGDTPVTEENPIYYDNLDKAPISDYGSSPYLDQWDGYINATGPGAGNVSYSGNNISVRDSYTSRGYEGASGQNAMNYGADNRSIDIRGVTIAPGQTTLKFSFGATPPSGGTITAGNDFSLYLTFDDGASTKHELDFTAKKGSGTWYLCSAVFELTGGTPSCLNFVISAKGKDSKVDDFRLVETGETASQTVKYTAKDQSVPWPEMPETLVENPNYKYVTHWAETVRSGKRVRNYSACYDTERHNPIWVAYPMHDCYLEGGYERTKPDPWRPDPKFSQSEQSVIYGSDWADWPWNGEDRATDLYQYWSPLDNGPFFGRGHILRSADRGGHNTLLNIQTFYPTNIAPERLKYPDVHAALENELSDSWTCSDTTYVVAGCYYGNDSYYFYDACWHETQSKLSKKCIVPVAEFKIYLRTKSGNTGKRICDCTADELMAIGFWLEQDIDNTGEIAGGEMRDFAMSVDMIEEKLGGEFRFFPEVPDKVTASYKLSDWGI